MLTFSCSSSLFVMLFTTIEIAGDSMALNEGMKNYRKEVLDLKQVEAAKRLNISKSSLSQYERGKRGLPNDVLSNMVKLYQLSPKELYEMVVGNPYPESHNDSSMVLRENFEDSEMERAITMLKEYPELRTFISTASYYDRTKQKRFFEKLIKLIKTLEE
jgi:transcriptional regulator with XRE-family HTH domain